jgi:hypothetical protein
VVIVLLLWLMAKTASGDRAAPAGLFHLALAGPAVILAVHFLWRVLPGVAGPRGGLAAQAGVRGVLDISAVYQFALIALAALLARALCASPAAAGVPALLAAAGMIVGALAGAFSGQADLVRAPLGLLAFSGAGLLLSLLSRRPYRPPRGARVPRVRSTPASDSDEGARLAAAGRGTRPHVMHTSAVAAVAVLCGALLLLFPRPGVLAAGLLALTALLGTILLGKPRLRLVASLALLLIVAGYWIAASGAFDRALQGVVPGFRLEAALRRPLGVGEEAYRSLSADTTGLEFLGDQVGWAGLAWLGGGLLAAAGLALWRARSTGEGAAAVFRLWSAGLAMAAFLAPQGLFVPSVSLAVGFTWGFLAAPAARPAHRWSGWALVGALGAVMLLLALAPDVGLLEWSCTRAGLHDDFLHVVCGLLFASILAWQVGRDRLRRGLVGVGLAAAAGGAGELLQALASTRNADWRDLVLHSAGCAAGAVPYLLALGARMCEEHSPPPLRDPGIQ